MLGIGYTLYSTRNGTACNCFGQLRGTCVRLRVGDQHVIRVLGINLMQIHVNFFSFKAVFQALLGSPLSYVPRYHQVSGCNSQWHVSIQCLQGLLHQRGTRLSPIDITLAFDVCIPPQSAPSHFIPKCLYT